MAMTTQEIKREISSEIKNLNWYLNSPKIQHEDLLEVLEKLRALEEDLNKKVLT